MSNSTSLTNQFLIAMPSLADPNFSRTVTLICEHNVEGAMGIVINRGLDLKLGDVLEQLDIETAGSEHAVAPVYLGGPVQSNRGFVVHEPLGSWESTLAVNETLGVSTSRDILTAIARDEGPDNWFVALGYAGWSSGQLEQEITSNSWLNGPADRTILFDLPLEERWQAAAKKLGVDLATLSGDAGHA